MEIVFLEQAEKDREYWKKSGNKAIMKKITDLLKDIAEHDDIVIVYVLSMRYHYTR